MRLVTDDFEANEMPELSTDCRYLEDDSAFVTCSYLRDWPANGNQFIKRMSNRLTPGFFAQMSVDDFMAVLSAFTQTRPHDCLTVAVSLDEFSKDSKLSFRVLGREHAVIPPITADNAGFFSFALSWFAAQGTTELTIGFSGSNLFWVYA